MFNGQEFSNNFENTDLLFNQLQGYIIGIWLFRRHNEISKWCITFQVGGMYFDVDGYEDIEEALKATLDQINFVKNKKNIVRLEEIMNMHFPSKKYYLKVNGLFEALEGIKENLVGLWKFRSAYTGNLWCATYIFNGCYYDTIGSINPISTIVRIKFEINNLITTLK